MLRWVGCENRPSSRELQADALARPIGGLHTDPQAIAKRPDDYLQQLLAYYQRIGGIFKVLHRRSAAAASSSPRPRLHRRARAPGVRQR